LQQESFAREVIYLKESLDAIIPIKTLALESKQEVKIIGDSLHSCELLREKIKTTLNQDAPAVAKRECDRKRVNEELDELRAISTLGKEFLEGIEARESERTGITSLKYPLIMFWLLY
jgi:DNA mismatch repair protein MutS